MLAGIELMPRVANVAASFAGGVSVPVLGFAPIAFISASSELSSFLGSAAVEALDSFAAAETGRSRAPDDLLRGL